MVSAVRATLAALDNEEAVPMGDHRAGAVETAAVGVGATDAPRRLLTWENVRGVLAQEVRERLSAAAEIEGVDPERALALRHDAASLDEIIKPLMLAGHGHGPGPGPGPGPGAA